MKSKFAFAAGLLAISLSLILISAPKAKALGDEEGGAGNQKWVLTDCVCAWGYVHGNSNDCDAGGTACNDNDCSHLAPCRGHIIVATGNDDDHWGTGGTKGDDFGDNNVYNIDWGINNNALTKSGAK